ncbi:hypothetical protein QTP88_019812 [Uroleucon formosanum]
MDTINNKIKIQKNFKDIKNEGLPENAIKKISEKLNFINPNVIQASLKEEFLDFINKCDSLKQNINFSYANENDIDNLDGFNFNEKNLIINNECVKVVSHSPLPVVESHVDSVEQIMSSYNPVSVILCGEYNLPNVTWSSDKLGLIATNDHNMVNTSIIYSFSYLNFFQQNFLPNSHGSILDLIFSNSNKVTNSTITDSFVIPDPYHPPLHIIIPFLSDDAVDNAISYYKEFKDTNYSAISHFFN